MDVSWEECVSHIDKTIMNIDNLKTSRVAIEDDLLEYVGLDESTSWELKFSEREREEKVLSRKYSLLREEMMDLEHVDTIDTETGNKIKHLIKETQELHQKYISKWRELQDKVIARLAELEAEDD